MKRVTDVLAGFIAVLLLCFGGTGYCALVDTRTDTDGVGATVDGSLGANEYGPGNSYIYTGGGGGFNGALGDGSLYFQSDSNNLYIAFQPGDVLDDNVVIHLDTVAGGFTDAQMNDTADPGRNLLSNSTRDVDDQFPTGVLPDYGLVIGSFGIVWFELNAGNTPGHLTFEQFSGTFTGNAATLRETSIPLATLGNPSAINFFATYGSNTNFMSNESNPRDQAYNNASNPGFDNSANGGGPVIHANHNLFITAVPEPGAFLFGAVVVTFAAAVAVKKRIARSRNM